LTVSGYAIDCHDFGTHRHHARGTAYYPDNSPIEGGFVDMQDTPLHTLQAKFLFIDPDFDFDFKML
jgi:hypothetical protein